MNMFDRPRRTRAAWSIIGLTVGALPGACQSYERAPLDIASHRDTLESRVVLNEPISAFLDRLADLGETVPERFDFSDGVTEDEGEVLALFYNPDLRLARLRAGVALAQFETAGLWEDPEFGFDAAEILSPASPLDFGFTLSLTIPVSGRLTVEKARAGAAYEAELRRIVDAEWSTRARVRTAWAGWTAAWERAGLLRRVAKQIDGVGLIADRLEAAGELTRIEARLLRTEAVRTRADLLAAGLAESRARTDLLRLLGLPPDAPIDLVHGFPTPQPPVPAADVDRLIEANTALAVRRAEYRTAEESLRLEVREQYPDITIGGGYGSEDSDDRLLLGVSLPIPVFNANRSGIAEARARRAIARAAAENTFDRLASDLADAQRALESVRAQRALIESELVPTLEQQSAEIDRLIELGEVDTLILLDTVRRGHDAKSRLLELRRAESAAMTRVAELLGPASVGEPLRTDPDVHTKSIRAGQPEGES